MSKSFSWLHLWAGVAVIALAGLGTPSTAWATQTRTYYIAAEELMWDFAPSGRDLMMPAGNDDPMMAMADPMMGMEFDATANVYVERTPERIGSRYKKALYVEYMDATFTVRKPLADEWAHLGLTGPVMHAEVGDQIRVVFRNNGSRPYSIHPHGVFYTKAAEGAATNDGTAGADRADDAVAPGATFDYVWDVPERAGPGPNDPSSIVWPYHSHVNSVRDSNSGLVGTIIITRAGMAKPDGTPVDVDREEVMLFDIFNENLSWYLGDNIAGLDDAIHVDPDDGEFVESNLKHAINGYVFGNMPMPVMKVGERVRWYLVALGTESDLHTPHWHGNTALVAGHRVDTVSLLPATTVVADMVPDDPGIWMFHCHVNDHIVAGMTARYEVLKQ